MATFGTFTSGQTLTAAELNTAGEWSSYTPTWTQSATITKTVSWARYTKLNKLVIASISMTASSAGTANNRMLVGLPVNASSNNRIMGFMNYFDSGSRYYFQAITALYESASTVAFIPVEDNRSASFGYSQEDKRFGENYTDSISKTGITVGSGDVVWIQLMYEAA